MLFESAFEQYKKSLNIQPDHLNNLGNYGIALSNLAKLKKEELLFESAFEQYKKALNIKSDHLNNLSNYGNARQSKT